MKVNPMVALFATAFLLTYLLSTANANPLHPTNQVGQMVDMLFETFGIDIIDHSARALDLKGDDVLKVNTIYLVFYFCYTDIFGTYNYKIT